MTPKVTNGGYGTIIRALDGEGIRFSKISIGNGELRGDYMTMPDLANKIMEIDLTEIRLAEQFAVLEGTVSNAGLENSFKWREVGIFCSDPEGGEDIMYAYGHNDLSGESPIDIPAAGGGIIELALTYFIYVGEVNNVDAILSDSAQYATKKNLREHIEDHSNPHQVTAEQVGLGNVPNKTTNNQTPTYTVVSTLAALKSGEILSTAFGKIAAAVNSLISHLSDKALHITAAERANWNAKAAGSHNHAASDVNSGTLGIQRGGTGKASFSSNKVLYGAFNELAQAAYTESVLMQGTSGPPYWKRTTETGSYTGGGKSGQRQPNTITFAGGCPKVVLIMQDNYSNVRCGILFPAANRGFSIVEGVIGTLIVSESENTVSWYYESTESHPANQLDHRGYTFRYIGFM